MGFCTSDSDRLRSASSQDEARESGEAKEAGDDVERRRCGILDSLLSERRLCRRELHERRVTVHPVFFSVHHGPVRPQRIENSARRRVRGEYVRAAHAHAPKTVEV